MIKQVISNEVNSNSALYNAGYLSLIHVLL